MRDPLVKKTPHSSLFFGVFSMYGATFRRRVMPRIAWNVSAAVFVRCAVQITVSPGCNRHRANTRPAIMYVLPTCRGMLR